MPKPKYHECDICGRVFSNVSNLYKHRRIHTNDKPFACDQCPYQSSDPSNLKKHVQMKHESKRLIHECDVCAVLFSHKFHLYIHKRNVHAPKNYVCDECDFRTATITRLKEHQRVKHSTIRPYQCEICYAKFKTSKTWRNHRRSHEVGPFVCDVEGCGVMLKTRLTLNRHKKWRHSSVKKQYRCEECQAVFRHKPTLLSHLVIHNEPADKFSCEECEFCCRTKTSLTNHVRRIHGEDRPFGCEVCGERFKMWDVWRNHKQSKHGDAVFKCDVTGCDKAYKLKSYLNEHKRWAHTAERLTLRRRRQKNPNV